MTDFTAGDPVCTCGCGGIGGCVVRWIIDAPELAEPVPTIVLTGFPESTPERCDVPGCKVCGGKP